MTVPLHQATSVAIGGRAILIEGPPGIGKSSLALALIDRGAVLVGDDGVALAARDGVLFASPAPLTAGKLEVRGVGLITMPFATAVPVALIIALAEDAPRFREAADRVIRGGIALPGVALWPGGATLALRAEAALRTWGLA